MNIRAKTVPARHPAQPKLDQIKAQAQRAPDTVVFMSEPPVRHATSQPTAQLRWSKTGVLQQGWNITEYEGGKPVSQMLEWRDVPREAEPVSQNQ